MTTFVPDWSGNFKRAIDKDVASLTTESDSAFGSASGSGKMPTTVGFDYGKNADGTAKTVPPTLAKPQA
jgi:signal recognition particle receptor subunit beta